MRNNMAILCILFVLMGCTKSTKKNSNINALPYYNEATFTPHWIDPNDNKLNTFHRISPFSLTNQNGEEINRKTFENKIYVTDFFFTSCPGICQKMTENMKILQEEFLKDKDVLLLSHSVTPLRDSVPVLKKYAKRKGINSVKWHIVTGPQDLIYKLGRQDYFIEENLGLEKEADDFLHTENFVLIDGNGYLRGIYNGLKKNAINQLIEDIRVLKLE